jgi:chromosome partitioning protein
MATVIVIVDLKGGSGKTTTAVYLAHMLAAWRRTVVLIDADGQQSARDWHDMADWPFPAVEITVPNRMRYLFGVIDPGRYDTVVIDTPPLERLNGVVEEALQHATLVLLPIGPTTIELHRLPATMAAIAQYAPNTPALVLLNRVRANTKATGTIRSALVDAGLKVLDEEIPMRQDYALAFGKRVPIGDVPYSKLVEELMKLGVV